MEWLNNFESSILLWIQQNLRVSIGDLISPWISAVNNAGIICFATIILLLMFKKYRNIGITALASLVMEFAVINLLIKPLVERTRPFYINELIVPLGKIPTDYSFPSGHTGAGFAVGVVLYMLMPKRFGIPAMIVVVLISLSRLYNGVHYPTDVLGGIVVGMTTAILSVKLLYPKICKRFKTQ